MSYIFNTEVGGIPYQCQVTYYHPGSPMVITGSGFGDATEPEPEEFEFVLLDMFGNETNESSYLSAATRERIKKEYLASVARNSDAD